MENSSQVWANIVGLLADVKDLEAETLAPETRLSELELDSLDYVEMMVTVKRDFAITLTPELFINHPDITLGKLCQVIADGKA